MPFPEGQKPSDLTSSSVTSMRGGSSRDADLISYAAFGVGAERRPILGPLVRSGAGQIIGGCAFSVRTVVTVRAVVEEVEGVVASARDVLVPRARRAAHSRTVAVVVQHRVRGPTPALEDGAEREYGSRSSARVAVIKTLVVAWEIFGSLDIFPTSLGVTLPATLTSTP